MKQRRPTLHSLKASAQMFLMLGGTLSFIIGLVGILNFFNAILTGIPDP